MIKIGEWNHLEVVKEKDFGIYLAEKNTMTRKSCFRRNRCLREREWEIS